MPRTHAPRYRHPAVGAVLGIAFTLAPALGTTAAAMVPAERAAAVATGPRRAAIDALALDPGLPARAARELASVSGGTWQVNWDARTGIAAWGRGGSRPTAAHAGVKAVQVAAAAFRDRHAALLGAAGTTLVPTRTLHAGAAWHVTWRQEVQGRRVVGAFLDLTLAEDGTVVGFHSTLAPGLQAASPPMDAGAALRALERELGRELVLERAESVVFRGEGPSAPIAATEIEAGVSTGARWRAVVDADGAVLESECLVREATLAGTVRSSVQSHYIQDEPVDVTLPWLEIRIGFAENGPKAHTDPQGAFTFDVDPGEVVLRCGLRGLYAWVDNESPFSPSPHSERFVAAPGDVVVRLGSAEAREDERTIYHHMNRMHDLLEARYGFALLDFPLPALAAAVDPFTGDPNYPNAYWNGIQLGFGLGGAEYWNLGLFSDVIYHEYTHAVTDYIYRPIGGLRGAQARSMHEGLSDYFAATLTDEPDLGEFLRRRSEQPLRTLDNRLIWPEHRDKRDEPHANGVIFAGALWDLRRVAGAEVADALVHFTRELFPASFEEFLECMLLEDDLLHDDGWTGNGSPHREAILNAFAAHGMGPLARHSLAIGHVPLSDTEDSENARRVVVRLGSFVRDDSGVVRLSYRSAGSAFTHVILQRDARGAYGGDIPAMPAGTRVQYYLAAARFDPIFVSFLPAAAPDSLFAYDVGPDLEPPRLAHTPVATVPALGWPPELTVHVEDNLGVAYAYAEVWRQGRHVGTVGFAPSPGEPQVLVALLPHTGGAVGERFQYAITAVDRARAGNTTRIPPTGSFEFVVVNDLLDGFEGGFPAWRHRAVALAQPDPWHLSTGSNHTPGGAQAWLCGSADGTYPPMASAELVSDWFRVDPGARGSIWSWMDAAVDVDGGALAGGRIEIQREGDSGWTLLVPESGYTHTMSAATDGGLLEPTSACLAGTDPGWQELGFDLSPWASRRARLRFQFGSASTPPAAPHHGWLLDDFSVQPGTPTPTDVVALPSRLQLQVGPNPFGAQLTFHLQVPPQAGALRLEILDARGRMLRRILDAPLAGGPHRLVWDGREADGLVAAAGVYYYRLVWNQGLETGKVVLVR